MVSLMIYVSAFLMIIGVMGTVINFFSDNTKEINLGVASSSEYNKFNLYMLEQTKNGFEISEGTTSVEESKYVTFIDENSPLQEKNTFVKIGNMLYFNQIKLCENVDDFKVKVEEASNGKKILKTYLQINGTVYTTDYVIEPIIDENNSASYQKYNSMHPENHIPTGFHYLTGTVNTGYVITDGTNEFVWIPVASEAVYTKKLGASNCYLTQASDQTASSLNYNANSALDGDVLGVNSILGKNVTSTLADRPEADIVNKAGGFWVGRYEAGTTSNTYSSTNTDTINTIQVKPGLQPAGNIKQSNALALANSWKSGNSGNGTVAFQSGLITGTQWDVMCKFIGWSTSDSDCKNWGNYKNSASSNYTGYYGWGYWNYGNITKSNNQCLLFATGKFSHSGKSTPSTAKKNIFDIAGNAWEWTTEQPNYNANHRVLRGGSTLEDSTNCMATFRNGQHNGNADVWWIFGFRIVLYVE